MERYLKNLIAQFKSATGTNSSGVNLREFEEWVRVRKNIGKDYKLFVDSMNTYPFVYGESSVEIGKGVFDSLILDTNIDMITPYSQGIVRPDGKLITADFRVFNGTPLIIEDGVSNQEIDFSNLEYIRRYMTHNPYSEDCIRNWGQLHNIGENVTVGIFGTIYDRDIKEKIKQLKTLKDRLNDDSFLLDYVTYGDNYFSALSSTRKVNVLKKTI